MKKIFVVLFLILCISGCSLNETNTSAGLSESSAENPATSYSPSDTQVTPTETTPTLEFSIEGTYICTGDYYNNNEFFLTFPEYIPHITFYKDGTCKIRAFYNEGLRELIGGYSVNKNSIFVKLDSQEQFAPEDWREMDDEFVFEIINNDEITIDRQFYMVAEGTSFTRLTLASIEQGNPGSIKTGVVDDGFRQYTATRSTIMTEEWLWFIVYPPYGTIRFTIILPDGYEMNNFIIYKENGFPNIEEYGIIRSPVKLDEEQQMPSNIETLQKYEEEFWTKYEDGYNSGSFPYYGGEMVSFGEKDIFIAHRDVGSSYLHAFFMTVDDYVFRLHLLNQSKYPETELLDLYFGIMSSIETVEVIEQ